MKDRIIATDLMVYGVYWSWNDYDCQELNAYTVNDSFETAIEAAKECYEVHINEPIPEDFEKLLRKEPEHEYEDENIYICIYEEPIFTRKTNLDS